jgi:diaminohydroxyphosphoribosylaminopyrimidine deaminase/5-amino-6-(5-phosphoribosylamino)uracil reductase
VILDSTARVPLSSRVISGELPGHTIVCTTERAPESQRAQLVDRGVEVIVLPEREGRVDVSAAMEALGRREVTSILCEGGGTLAWSLVEGGVVDKVLAFVAPKIVGGEGAPTPVGGLGMDRMSQAVGLVDVTWTSIGPDLLLTAYINASER